MSDVEVGWKIALQRLKLEWKSVEEEYNLSEKVINRAKTSLFKVIG